MQRGPVLSCGADTWARDVSWTLEWASALPGRSRLCSSRAPQSAGLSPECCTDVPVEYTLPWAIRLLMMDWHSLLSTAGGRKACGLTLLWPWVHAAHAVPWLMGAWDPAGSGSACWWVPGGDGGDGGAVLPGEWLAPCGQHKTEFMLHSFQWMPRVPCCANRPC